MGASTGSGRDRKCRNSRHLPAAITCQSNQDKTFNEYAQQVFAPYNSRNFSKPRDSIWCGTATVQTL